MGDEINGIFNNSKKLDKDNGRCIFFINNEGIIIHEKSSKIFETEGLGQDNISFDFDVFKKFPQQFYSSNNDITLNKFYLFKVINES